jgi:lipopolysaccharide export system permease protein
MAAIANRYILREAAQTWLAVTAVLLLILVTNQFAKVLGDAAANQLPKEALLRVMGLTSLQYMTILIPAGLFLAILLALGRLYRDSEMYALMACGVGPAQLYRSLMGFALLLAAVVGWLALDVSPSAIREVRRIGQEARARSDLRIMEAGRFVKFGQADAVVYAEEVTADGRLRNVFVQRRRDGIIEVIVAVEARQQDTADPNVKMLTFSRGRRYEGEPGGPRFKVVEFAEHGIPYSLPAQVAVNFGPKGRSVAALLASRSLADVAELQWRLSVPLMVLVLTLLAVPLGRSSPRQGRYAGLIAGLLIYISYSNLLGAARVWVERGKVPPLLGLWWVHALYATGAVVLLVTRYGLLSWRPWRRREAVSP